MNRVRVLHCAETIKGGIATYLNDLLPLQRAEFGPNAVSVVTRRSHASELRAPEGVEVVFFDDGASRILDAIRLARIVVSQCRRHRPAVVHVHSTFAGIAVRPLVALAAPASRIVYCAHGWVWDRPMPSWARKATMFAERLLARFTSTVVCISDYERRSALAAGLPEDRLRLVLNGVSGSAPQAQPTGAHWPADTLRVLFVGRFDRQKGVDLLLDALREVGPEVYAVLAGAPVLRDGAGLDLPPNARSAGWLPPEKLQALFLEADVLAVPSRWEGFGLVAVEAMRAGLPVIAAGVGGLPEVVADGETGFVISPNSKEALAAALRRMKGADLKRMGNAARKRFESMFTMDRVHRELCEVYDLAANASSEPVCRAD